MPTYSQLQEALNALSIPFREEGWATAPHVDYGVYALDTTGETLHGDNGIAERAMEGTIDLYSFTDGKTAAQSIESALKAIECPYRLNSIQYENETHLTHFEWVFQCLWAVI